MKDPFWGAFFGALQKEKYKDAVSAISNIDKVPEAFKNIAEAFKTAYTMRDAKVCNQCNKVLPESEEDSHPDFGYGKRDTLIDVEDD